MSNDKYIAILDKYVGDDSDSAFCTVLAKQISNSLDGYVIEEEKLIREFDGFREIFVPRLKHHNFKEGEVLSFTKKELISQEGRKPRLHFSGVEKANVSICIELKKVEIDDVFLNVELLQENIISRFTATETSFYVSDGVGIYGDFRIERNKVKAGYGVNVNRYLADQCLKIEHPYADHSDITLLLHLPKDGAKKYDCSTNTQLIERVKDIIGKSKITNETGRYINHIKALITSEDLDEIEVAKIKRVQVLLDKVSLKYEQFEALRSNSEFWSDVFNNSIKEFEERLTNEFWEKNKEILDLEMQKQSEKLDLIQQRLTDEETRLEEIVSVTLKENEILESLNNQINLLELKKDEIILSFQVQGKIGNGAVKEFQPNYEIQQSLNKCNTFYPRPLDFLNELSIITELEEAIEEDLHKVIKQLKCNNFFKCSNISNFMTLVDTLGNSCLYLNNAEVDWIKFDKFMKQGLLEAFKHAYNKPLQSVYYLLQDFNIASPECYAKPLIDLSRKIRKTLPVDGRSWPKNFRVVFFPLELDIDDFGFDVNEETFSRWEELEVPFFDCNGFNLPKALNLENR
ncbi:hypothetical protein FM120_11265 [Sphingobacterium faecium PCAi_F2.5]|nr:hypothetical protein FM120_11265 [Sphingobacterium faecium PCAi_F2.5]